MIMADWVAAAVRALLFSGITGCVGAVLHLHLLSDLWATSYGRMLSLKISLALGAMALGGFNWKIVGPRVRSYEPGSTTTLARSARVELSLAIATIIITAILVATPLPGE